MENKYFQLIANNRVNKNASILGSFVEGGVDIVATFGVNSKQYPNLHALC